MELNHYQRRVMGDLSSYLAALDKTEGIKKAWATYWQEKEIAVGLGGVPAYRDRLPGTPHICLKVPTGSGKTFLVAASVKPIFDAMPSNMPKVIIWLVPSDFILSQTVRALSLPTHPYRLRLERDFGGRVAVCTKDMLLAGEEFSPDTVQEMLTVCVLSYASLRIDSKKKDVRKVYQENGNLRRFAEFFQNRDVLLADTPDTALIQVVRQLSPVVIVDESHNAGSALSTEMLSNLNPSFVLELTATPRESSNIISYVDARELKKENMVKLPVVVFHRFSRQSVITDAIQLRGSLEKAAQAEEKANDRYIRPIVLFQAQPKVKEDSETFDKIKNLLLVLGIPAEEIAVKTSKVDDLGSTDLMSRDCPIRYIITVNALKEGWYCPFAYILASLANKSSKVDVEQILGRILRQPYAQKHGSPLLNTSYVLACSNDFHDTLENIVAGLNQAGFSRKDCRVAEENEQLPTAPTPQGEQIPLPISDADEVGTDDNGQEDSFEDIHLDDAKETLGTYGQISTPSADSHISEMVKEAETGAEEYEKRAKEEDASLFAQGELAEMVSQYAMQPQYREKAATLRLPQFYLKTAPNLFGGEYELLEPEDLSKGFTLAEQDAQVSFGLAMSDVYHVDVQADGEAVPKYKKASRAESDFLREYLDSLPTEKRLGECTKMLAAQVNKNDRYSTRDVADYVRRVVSGISEDELAAMEMQIPVYARRIQQKIDKLETLHREKNFRAWLDAGKIVCREGYELPKAITAAETIDAIPSSLYEAEKDDMNRFEREVVDVLTGANILWWHRIIERKGFCLNGYFNHYPDFLVLTKSGKILLIEAKGDYLDGDDSKAKLALGRKWQSMAGENYRYFMVFKNKELALDGSYTLDDFAEIMQEI